MVIHHGGTFSYFLVDWMWSSLVALGLVLGGLGVVVFVNTRLGIC
jgi:hypothetical protein